MKTDKSIKNICIAAVKRKTIQPFDYTYTKFFDEGYSELVLNVNNLNMGELPIAETYIDNTNWSLITTRRILSNINGEIGEINPNEINSMKWSGFKHSQSKQTTFGEMKLHDGNIFYVHIEVGRASMIIISAINTLVGQIKFN